MVYLAVYLNQDFPLQAFVIKVHFSIPDSGLKHHELTTRELDHGLDMVKWPGLNHYSGYTPNLSRAINLVAFHILTQYVVAHIELPPGQ